MSAPLVIGVVLSTIVAIFASRTGLDRDRAFYPTLLIVVALYYVLFAAMTGSPRTVLIESLAMAGFATVAVRGFKSSEWIVAAGLVGHGVFDGFHPYLVDNPGVPVWWPAFCAAYDIGAGGVLAWFIRRRARWDDEDVDPALRRSFSW